MSMSKQRREELIIKLDGIIGKTIKSFESKELSVEERNDVQAVEILETVFLCAATKALVMYALVTGNTDLPLLKMKFTTDSLEEEFATIDKKREELLKTIMPENLKK